MINWLLASEGNKEDSEKPDYCSCSACGWGGLITDCEQGNEQDGWENPPYVVDVCPKCGESVDDYYFNEEIK